MVGTCLKFENPIEDAISRIRFAPQSNNLVISSWDSTLRLYDVDNSAMRLEEKLDVALLGCCFQDESAAFSIGSDCCVRRHDFGSEMCSSIGNHDDLATSVEYSEETGQVITAGLDKKILSWDTRTGNGIGYSKVVDGEVDCISLCGLHVIIGIGKSVNMYDLRNFNGPVQINEPMYMDSQIRSIGSFPNCEGYAVGSIDGRVALQFLNASNANEMSCVFRCCPKAKDRRHHHAAVNEIVFHPRRYGSFITGDNEGYAIVWDAQSKKRLFEPMPAANQRNAIVIRNTCVITRNCSQPGNPLSGEDQFSNPPFLACLALTEDADAMASPILMYNNSVASLSYNHGGQLLAVASSYTYQEANEIEEPPQIFIHRMNENHVGSSSAGSSK